MKPATLSFASTVCFPLAPSSLARPLGAPVRSHTSIGKQAVLVSILPIVPAYLVCWPWAISLSLQGHWMGVILALSQYLLLTVIDTELCAQVSTLLSCRGTSTAMLLSTVVLH